MNYLIYVILSYAEIKKFAKQKKDVDFFIESSFGEVK